MQSDITIARLAEAHKYEEVYRFCTYKMGDKRFIDAAEDLAGLPYRTSLLDVGCGRGEILVLAEALGFERVQGVELVSYLLDPPRIIEAPAWALPFKDDEFDAVTMFDVIEHLVPADEIPVLEELARVAAKTVILTANNRPSKSLGHDLHINTKPYETWHNIFKDTLEPLGWVVTRIEPKLFVSATWRFIKI